MDFKIFKRGKNLKRGIRIRNFVLAALLVIFVVFILCIGILSWGIYKLEWRGHLIENIMMVIPMPVAKVGNNYVFSSDYYADLKSARKFYAKQKENNFPNIPSDADLKKIILEDRLIENILVGQIARKYKITVTDQEINDKMDAIIKNKGSQQEVEKFLADNYGLDISGYKKYFIKPNLFYDKTNQAVIDDESINGAAKKKIQDALNHLRNNEDFDKVAMEYTEESDPLGNKIIKENFLRGELPNDIEDQLYGMKEGTYTDVLTLPTALAIFKLDKKDENKGVLGLSTIIVNIKTLKDILPEEKQKTQIKIYVY
ncbi:MAG: SurA N-terminal domain-containing protein [Candidatus Parcubacteria bacterium]|nr:SurA N-terminal domain-containing protein [Candidatus Parcubacteria bacterium]